ncbi:glycosyltransferase family 2 protein [Skermanella sp. TT6]|uniref:Glycosyltransferase family 2 protein n=1 Tax=Skermanella cutis TaxID=2775420 RepID=A0ABX7B7C6_9PROT|nr:glycosyltransferase family 2 protein [Skermanella sp. TT6]QQP90269.1 glycosyltransferase family 2 protein [Skermanella sp. TT6]
MTTEAPVCVIVVNHNGGALLSRCIDSLAAQTVLPRDVVVVDNLSTDGSAAFLETLSGPLAGRVRLIAPGANLGFAAANNLAAGLTREPWIALLNPDAFPEPRWLEALADATVRHPDVAMFGSTQIDAESPGRLDGAGDVYHASGLVWRGHHGAPVSELPPEGEVFAPCAAAALYRRDAFLAAGGFDEGFFCYCEDVDLGFRLRLAGERCVQVASARVLHVGSAITGRRSGFATYHGTRNRVWMFVKNMPAPLLIGLLPVHLAVNGLMLARGAVLGQGGPMLRGLRDAVRHIGPVLAERRAIQARRRLSAAGVARAVDWSVTGLLARRARPLDGPSRRAAGPLPDAPMK